MASPRYTQVDIEATPYYHCISRCVRRAFLCGEDAASGRNFDHRKAWVVERIASLANVFAIRVCAYAVLSNHFHLVLRMEFETARAWDDDEVVQRYGQLFRGAKDPRKLFTADRAAERIRRWRARLADLSWFMRCLNEAIARRANAEDECTGRFWEGRFRSQALLDEAGLLTCMSYVDLNPIRAGIAASLEQSDFTSIQQRISDASERSDGGDPLEMKHATRRSASLPALVPFAAAEPTANEDALPVGLSDYVDILTATGAALRSRDPGVSIPQAVGRTLERLGIASYAWLETIRFYHQRFFAMVGTVHAIDIYCGRTDRSRSKGRRWAARAFRAPV